MMQANEQPTARRTRARHSRMFAAHWAFFCCNCRFARQDREHTPASRPRNTAPGASGGAAETPSMRATTLPARTTGSCQGPKHSQVQGAGARVLNVLGAHVLGCSRAEVLDVIGVGPGACARRPGFVPGGRQRESACQRRVKLDVRSSLRPAAYSRLQPEA